MSLRLSVREKYLRDEVVQFSASVDPGGATAILPNPKPYSISRNGNVVHQPSVPSRRLRLNGGGGVLLFEWDQFDQFGRKVPVGEYLLSFVTVNLGEHGRTFAISSNWKDTLKGGAKWSSRALAAGAAFSAFFEPFTGAALGLAAVGTQVLADDPPDDNYLLIAEVKSVHDRIQDELAYQPALGYEDVLSTLRFYDFTLAIRQTVERDRRSGTGRSGQCGRSADKAPSPFCAASWLYGSLNLRRSWLKFQ